ncbi:MAG: DUF2236 domain-containing protein, partial [Verrucomicrobiae bacterium]|nr:DUF2236 domain-containing protein [Verrucomicrobiae bacterium]
GELSHDRGSRRFLWGPGYLAARKVRMLHASMRFMLQHKARFSDRANRPPPHTLSERVVMEAAAGRPDWPTGQLGVPVNQEDLAYTLLTFAYVIPVGLDHWGAGLSAKQKDGFLHLWKVVGHVMGLREDLLPDDWDEARFLYESIQGSECGDSSRVPSTAVPSGEAVPHDSEPGVVLTEAVMRFLEDYLPRTLGLNALIGAGLIRDQMGPELAGQLLPQKDFRRASSLASRLVMAGFRGFARCYFLLYREIAERIPLVSRLMENVFERAADELVNSWRDAYSRRPFYIPNTYNEWVRVPGADDAYLARLKDWRERVFVGVVQSLLTFFVALLSFLLWLVCLVLHPVWAGGFGWVSLGTFLATVFLSEVHLPRVYRARPKVPAAPAQPDVVNLTPCRGRRADGSRDHAESSANAGLVEVAAGLGVQRGDG